MSKTSRKQLTFISFNFIYLLNVVTIAQNNYVDRVCDNDYTYIVNGTFRTNLDKTLADLPTTNSGHGFFNSSSGEYPHTAYAIGLCRGDHTDQIACGSCLDTSIVKLRNVCPKQKDASVYYDNCMVKYSYDVILYRNSQKHFNIHNSTIYSKDVFGFNRSALGLVKNLTIKAAAGGPLLKYAAGTTPQPNLTMIYGFVQCTPDLTEQQCSNCLDDAVSRIGSCCFGKLGVRVLLPKCNLRYENYRFYDDRVIVSTPTPTCQGTYFVISDYIFLTV
ncbi:unnamed protein product [Lactuca virosa]|uniref:Gnk2-homologous domain-containing protein n=1 Tax=Lactuca virosa TaxID=75947 RepID=A0AAU9MKQ7_9ASTR|nr:unnamed protein product [Lactuca virosa]